MQIPETLLEQLNSQADLVGMIGKHTTLKPAGREFKGCCPFHGEKTPSFYVNPETNLYYCFGCHAKGNAIGFLKDFERFSFIEAVKYLSEQTGIELPKDDNYQKKLKYKKIIKSEGAKPYPTDHHHFDDTSLQDSNHKPTVMATDWQPNQPPTQEQAQGDLYSLLDSICQYYQFMLHSTPAAKQYFLDRGLSEQTITAFGLGYAPEGWQHLEQVFPQDLEGLQILGLVRQSKTDGRTFDLLRHRVIFPIRDNQGRVIGFAGRSLGDEMPKYINSSESPVFQKQHILYGLYEARKQKASDYLVVEGYMDVISLYQAGIYGAVAPMGTAVNQKQIERLLRYNPKLTLCFDGDNAGQRAAWRTLEVAAPILYDDKELRFLILPDNHDPDTYIQAHGAEAMRQAIDKALSLSAYLYSVLASQYDLTRPESKAHAMAALRELTEQLPKGSSLKWWLSSDIYQKIKALGNNRYPSSTVDVIDYTHDATDTISEIGLYLLHNPALLTPDPLAYIITNSGMDTAHLALSERLTNQAITPPELPSWQNLASPMLSEIIATIQALPDELVYDDAVDANQRAYFIIAAMSDETKQQLTTHWQHFTQTKITQKVQDNRPLFFEILCNAIQDWLKNEQQKNSRSLLLSEIYKRRLQALNHWDALHNKAPLAEILTK